MDGEVEEFEERGGHGQGGRGGEEEAKKKHVPPEIIVGVSKLLSIDPIKEPQYLWIAEECAKAELPSKEWRELTNEDGETMWVMIKYCM